VLHGDGDADIGRPHEQIAAQLLHPRERLAEQEAREHFHAEQQDEQSQHDGNDKLFSPIIEPAQYS